jgi:hypothetical protein
MGSSLEVKYNDLSQFLEADYCVRERLRPRAGSSSHLHLVDLREAIGPLWDLGKIRILDYGFGGSPYRSLFPNCEYFRADFTPCAGLDFLLPADSSIPAPDGSVDVPGSLMRNAIASYRASLIFLE